MNTSVNSQCGHGRLSVRTLFFQVSASLIARAVGPLSAFFLALIIARNLGAESMGRLYVALTLLGALGLIARLGMDIALLRLIGAASDTSLVRGYYLSAVRLSFALATLIGVLLLLNTELIAIHILGDAGATELVFIVAFAIPVFSQLGIQAAVMKAMAFPVRGGFFEVSLWPLISLLLISLAMLTTTLTEILTLSLYLVAIVFSITLCWSYSRKLVPSEGSVSTSIDRDLLSSALPLASVELFNVALLSLPLLMLSVLADIDQAGLYSVSQKLAAQVGLLMAIFSAITAPRFAALYAQRNVEQLITLAGNSTRMLFLLSLLPSLLFSIWADDVLSIFGSEFLDAKQALLVLLFGFCVKHALGPVGYVLAMTGHERDLRYISVISLFILILSGLVFIPQLGATGAALSTTLAMLVQASVACFTVQRRLNLPLFLISAK